jgi:hypothetical protein
MALDNIPNRRNDCAIEAISFRDDVEVDSRRANRIEKGVRRLRPVRGATAMKRGNRNPDAALGVRELAKSNQISGWACDGSRFH